MCLLGEKSPCTRKNILEVINKIKHKTAGVWIMHWYGFQIRDLLTSMSKLDFGVWKPIKYKSRWYYFFEHSIIVILKLDLKILYLNTYIPFPLTTKVGRRWKSRLTSLYHNSKLMWIELSNRGWPFL